MKTFRIALAGLIAVTLSMVAGVAADDGDDQGGGNRLQATLVGFNEVPSVSTAASGRFRARISQDEQSIEYTLSYSGLSSVVQQAHIHFAQQHTNGGIVVWLCQGAVRAPAAVANLTPECPQEGEVSGTITAASVLTIASTQQIAATELAEVIAALRGGAAYANVHSAISGGGEIRGQVRVSDR